MNTVIARHPQVAPLEAYGAADVATAGGKAANLGELLRAGLPVPPGFVVTTAAYAEAAERAGLNDLLSDPSVTPSELRAAIRAIAVGNDLRAAIVEAYRRLGERVPVAVRSSATAEDLPGAAFAGQQDTYLNVVGAAAVVDAVRGCWESLWTDRAVAYRDTRSIDPREVRIAVVVQEMIESEVAGVMFTADPVTGARDRIVVDAGAGLGEAVVSGLVTPDHYVLDRTGTLREWVPGRGEVVIRGAAGGGVRHETQDDDGADGPIVPDRRPGRPGARDGALLEPDALRVLAGHARTIAAHFGRPQDIEWAMADGRIWIVQARPMTALPPDTGPLSFTQRLQAKILTEFIPVRPYPMDMTTLLARGPAQMMNAITSHFGLRGAFASFLREEEGVVAELRPQRIRPTPRALLNPIRVVRKARRFAPAAWERDPRQAAFLAEMDVLEALDLSAMPWSELLSVPDRALDTLDYCRDLRIDYLPGSLLAIVRMVGAVSLLGRRELIADLGGGAPTRTDAYNRALALLADQVRADRELLALVVGNGPAEALAAIEDRDAFSGFRANLDRFLREFGRRETTSPLLVSTPTLAESPEVVLGMVAALAQRDAPPDEPASRSAVALEKLFTHRCLKGRRSRERIRRWVTAAQEGVAFREDTHFYFAAPLPTLRAAVLEIGRRLRSAGLLADAADVFHLRWDEVTSIRDPERIPAGRIRALRRGIRQRAAKRAELSHVPLIDVTRVFPSAAAGDALVSGTAAGAGTVTGVARIVRGAEDFHKLGEGEILVCPYTNPVWTPLFQRAAAVVVDTGALASHAAIVAREYGIPAVMGTGNGTSVIADGQRIAVDGARGRVTRAPEEA